MKYIRLDDTISRWQNRYEVYEREWGQSESDPPSYRALKLPFSIFAS